VIVWPGISFSASEPVGVCAGHRIEVPTVQRQSPKRISGLHFIAKACRVDVNAALASLPEHQGQEDQAVQCAVRRASEGATGAGLRGWAWPLAEAWAW
jgi:hypothetical protein